MVCSAGDVQLLICMSLSSEDPDLDEAEANEHPNVSKSVGEDSEGSSPDKNISAGAIGILLVVGLLGLGFPQLLMSEISRWKRPTLPGYCSTSPRQYFLQ